MTKASILVRRPVLLSFFPVVAVSAVLVCAVMQYCDYGCPPEQKRIENLFEMASGIALFVGALIWLFLIFNAFKAGISRGLMALIGSVCLGFLGFFIVAMTGWSQM
jgi:hypothetical protein